MKNFADETPSELLTQLLDSELDAVSEQFLYKELSVSTELQNELKHHLSVREAIRKDTEAFTPPASAVKGIFDSLGYAVPPNASNGIIKRSPMLMSFFRKAAAPLLILLIGSLTTYNIIINQNDNEKSIVKSKISNKLYESDINQTNTNSNQVVSDTKESDNDLKNFKSKARNNNVIPVVESSDNTNNTKFESISDREQNIAGTTELIAMEADVIPQINIIQSSEYINGGYDNKFSFNNTNEFGFINSVPEFQHKSKSFGSVYIKSYSGSSNGLGSISSFDNLSNNFSLGVSFYNTGSLKGGFEIGQQPYSMLRSDPTNESLLESASQSVFWYAGSLRYDADFLEIMNVHPYVQGSLGGANRGKYMYRYSLGIEANLYSSFGIIAGYESSTLFYSIQGNPYNTSTNGLFIGLKYGF